MRQTTIFLVVLLGLLCATPRKASAQATSSRSVQLDVVVAAKSGTPVAGLGQQDFTLLDNNSPQPLTSFKAVTSAQEPIEVILLFDAVNADFEALTSARQKVQDFLRDNGGRLAYPMTFAVVTDKSMEVQKSLSTDGNALSDALGRYTIGLREISRGVFRGAIDQVEISLTGLRQLTSYAATLPGRKIILWISPGWPMMGNPFNLTPNQRQQIFDNVVSFSTQMRQAGVTLYNINPQGVYGADYYNTFVKGISKPSQTDMNDLGLQVLAIQSGGLALEANSDIAGMLKRCLADMASWYEITFAAPVAEQPNEYHHFQIKLEKPGLTARTRVVYYAQP